MGIRSERVDDIPLLVSQLERMGVPRLLDEQYGRHGNWRGLSLGWVATVWLSHILSQVKVMLSTLDPLGLPVATEVLAGDRADDPLYRPAIARVRTSLGQRGLLYVGDAKMAALETRAEVHAGGDHYLCPLTAIQV